MTQPTSVTKRGHFGVLLITIAAILIISPAYVAGYLVSHRRLSISLAALLSLAMFLIGAFLIIRILKE